MAKKFLSRKLWLTVLAMVFGILGQMGVTLPDGLAAQITSTVVEVVALVAYLIANVEQKKTEAGVTVELEKLGQ